MAAADRLRALTDGRWPRVPSIAGDLPPDAPALLEEAEQFLRGNWAVFERPLQVGREGPHWRRHPISGHDTPLDHFSRLGFHGAHVGGDIKFLWEINRHVELVRLAQGYLLSRSEEMATVAVGWLERWWDENPCGLGINWISALEVAFRLVAWCHVWQYTKRSSAWTAERARRLLFEVDAACRFVQAYDSVHHSPNTHLTGEAVGVLYASTLFSELRSAAGARAWAITTLQAEVSHQFLRDGMHFERATGYHRYHTEFYLHASALARHHGEVWDRHWEFQLAQALDVTASLRRPDGRWPVIGDEDGGAMIKLWAGDARDQGHLLALGARLFAAPRWAQGLEARHDALPWWLLGPSAESSVAEAQRDSPRTAVRRIDLPHAGYLGAADSMGWYVLVDAGAHGGDITGHAHTDVGHVEVCLGDTPVLVDSGCAVYTADETRRDWYRSLAAHATVTVNEDPLAVARDAFKWLTIAPTPQAQLTELNEATTVHLRYAGSSGQWQHERVVVLVHSIGVLIADFVLGSGVDRVQWNWPMAADAALTLSSSAATSVESGSARLLWCGSTALSAEVVPTRVSPSYGLERIAHGLRLSAPSPSGPVAAAMAITSRGDPSPRLVVLEGRVEATFPGLHGGASTVVEVRPGGLPVGVSAASRDS